MAVEFRRLFIFRKDLHMSTGNLLAQLGHCAEWYWTKALIRGARQDGDTYRCQVNILAARLEGYVTGAFVKISPAGNSGCIGKKQDSHQTVGVLFGELLGN